MPRGARAEAGTDYSKVVLIIIAIALGGIFLVVALGTHWGNWMVF